MPSSGGMPVSTGGAASGSPPAGNPIQVAGYSSGTGNVESLLTDTSGNLITVASATNFRGGATTSLECDTGGRLFVTPYAGGTALEIGSTGANAALTATLAAAAGVSTYITGFSVTCGGATAGSLITVTVTGPTNTLSYILAVPTGVTLQSNLLIVFPFPVAASAANTAIVVNMPAAGAGNTSQAVMAYGFRV